MKQLDRPRYFSRSVDGAAQVLTLLSRYRTQSSTLTEIAQTLDMSKTSCMRVVKTLQYHGLVDYEENSKKYRLGYFAVILGARAEEGSDTMSRAKPLMREITQRTELTSALVQRISRDRMMYVAKNDGRASPHVNVSVGNRFPLFEVSYGKWAMAFTDDAERASLVPSELPRMTAATRTDRDAYLREVGTLGAYSVLESRDEYVQAVYAASVPILDALLGGLQGVLVVLEFSERIDEEKAQLIRDVMRDVARRCNAHVKASGSPPPSFSSGFNA